MKTQYEPPTLKYKACSHGERIVVLSLLLMVAVVFQQCMEDRVKAPVQVSEAQQNHRIGRLVDNVSATFNVRAEEIKKQDEDAWPYFTFDIVRNKRNGQVFLVNFREKRMADDDLIGVWLASDAWGDADAEVQYLVSFRDSWTTDCATMDCVAARAVTGLEACFEDKDCYCVQSHLGNRSAARSTIRDGLFINEVNQQFAEEVSEALDVSAEHTLILATVTFYPSGIPEG